MKGYKYIVAGEADRQIDPSDDDIVTVEKVWQCPGILLSSEVEAATRRRRDLCLSLAMFKLLRRRLGGFPLTEARHNKTRATSSRYRSPKETLIPDALLFAAVVVTSLCTLFSPAVLDYRRPSSSSNGIAATGFDIWLTRTVIALFLVLESFQFFMLVFSDWHKVKMLCRYVREPSWHNRPGLQRMLKLMCQVRLTRYWNNSVGQYSLLPACLHYQRKGTMAAAAPRVDLWFPDPEPDDASPEAYRAGEALHLRVPEERASWATSPPAVMSRRSTSWATTLSAYCAYLVSSAPELLPEHSYDTRLLLDGVQSEAPEILKGCRSRDSIYPKLQVPADPPSVHRYILAEGKRLGDILRDHMPGTVSKWKFLAELWGGAAPFCCAVGQRKRSCPKAGRRWRAHHAPLGTAGTRRGRREAHSNTRKQCMTVCNNAARP
ncbi:hypothetical protein HU200_013832 [Digitaria exilis]|uniref:DUF4220 domain-containing protein n=1 Tax=Digitaria exilis TaxID=1010633 RepID=A0A835KNG5_9POAL|nr:hypothetical protein HU200_013832 [Digitaria exilis]